MAESARKKMRLSPRQSEEQTENSGTIYADLQKLANTTPKPVTPFRRAASATPTPGSRPIRTPGTGRTPGGGPATRPLPSRRAAPTTPHAIRALRERKNAARTPGRRRSGKMQRETPRDILRDLSKVLARSTRPAQLSPQEQSRPSRHPALDLPDVDDGSDLAAPRLSMPLEDMYDDDSIHEAPPRQSLLPNLPDDVDNGTIQSLEMGRRAFSEDPRMMFAARVSERFADLNELGIDGEEYEVDGTFVNRRRTINADEMLEQVQEEDLDEMTAEIRALTSRRDGRPSDADLGIFGEMDDDTEEPTFRFTIPQRIQAQAQEAEDDPEAGLLEEALERTTDGDDQSGSSADEEENEAAIAADADEEDENFGNTGWESDHEQQNDADLQAYREEESAIDRSLQTQSPTKAVTKPRTGRQRRAMNMSRSGHEYPSFPAATVKTLATGFAKFHGSNGKIMKDTLAALVQTSDFFFEQIGEDLAAYAQHGGRKVIEESDVIAMMKRTRQITSNSTVFSLAQKLLPRELLQQLRMQPLPKLKGQRQKRKRMEPIDEEEEV